MVLEIKFLDDYYDAFMITDPIETIAWRLTQLFRFAGESIISVALHSLIVEELVRQAAKRKVSDPKTQCIAALLAIMHDAHETLLTDIPTPVGNLIDKNHNNCLQNIRKQVDKYLFERCFPILVGRITPAQFKTAAVLVNEADNHARDQERKWLKDYGYAIRLAATAYDQELHINQLIINTIPERTGGPFAPITQDTKHTYALAHRPRVHTMWEQAARRAVANLHKALPPV